MKIQETTVTETGSEQAIVEILISDTKNPEPTDQYLAFSVRVSTEVKPPLNSPISFRVLQTRALKEAAALLGQADNARQQ